MLNILISIQILFVCGALKNHKLVHFLKHFLQNKNEIDLISRKINAICRIQLYKITNNVKYSIEHHNSSDTHSHFTYYGNRNNKRC